MFFATSTVSLNFDVRQFSIVYQLYQCASWVNYQLYRYVLSWYWWISRNAITATRAQKREALTTNRYLVANALITTPRRWFPFKRSTVRLFAAKSPEWTCRWIFSNFNLMWVPFFVIEPVLLFLKIDAYFLRMKWNKNVEIICNTKISDINKEIKGKEASLKGCTHVYW